MSLAAPNTIAPITSPNVPSFRGLAHSPLDLRGRVPCTSVAPQWGGTAPLLTFAVGLAVIREVRALKRNKVGSRRSKQTTVIRRAKKQTISVDVGVAGDIPPAADITVRSLRWTKYFFETPDFSENEYAYLAGNERQAYAKLYFREKKPEGVFIVAKAQEEAEKPSSGEASPFSLFGSGSQAGPRSEVVGCVGCEVRCFNMFTGQEIRGTNMLNGDDRQFRPVVADLAVDSAFRGKGIAKKLMAKLEEVVKGWGYEEVILFVEATNFSARNLYSRLGYRLSAVKTDVETTYLAKQNGKLRLERGPGTVAFLLRKSLKDEPWGDIENFNWGGLAIGLGVVNGLLTGQIQLGPLITGLQSLVADAQNPA